MKTVCLVLGETLFDIYLVPRRLSSKCVQRKAGRSTLPMVPCGSSPVTRVSRSPLPASSLGASFFAWFDIVLYSVVACIFQTYCELLYVILVRACTRPAAPTNSRKISIKHVEYFLLPFGPVEISTIFSFSPAFSTSNTRTSVLSWNKQTKEDWDMTFGICFCFFPLHCQKRKRKKEALVHSQRI